MRSVHSKIRVNNFLRKHSGLSEILIDNDLARLGDSYVNFVYSIAESNRSGKGSNSRVPAKVLAESLKRSGLRNLLPKRMPIHDQADAVEALVVYAWLVEVMSLEECVSFLSEAETDDVELFTGLVGEINRRLTLSFESGKVQGD